MSDNYVDCSEDRLGRRNTTRRTRHDERDGGRQEYATLEKKDASERSSARFVNFVGSTISCTGRQRISLGLPRMPKTDTQIGTEIPDRSLEVVRSLVTSGVRNQINRHKNPRLIFVCRSAR